jgi:hypothetical protein
LSQILFFLIVALCCLTVLWALLRPAGLYHYPTLCALAILGWVVPQLVTLLHFPDLPAGAFAMTLAMIALSLAATLWGWRRGDSGGRTLPGLDFHDGRLLLGAAALSLFGAFFRLAIRDLPAELLEARNWSGPQTIYITLAGTQTLAMALAWLVFLRSRSLWALGIALFNLSFFMNVILLGGKRGVMVEVGFVFLAGLWLTRRWAPPRLALLAGAAAAAILFTVIGEFRAATNARSIYTDRIGFAAAWENIKAIDFLASFQGQLEERDPRQMELFNAVHVIGATQQRADFQGPANYWDNLVFSYVPGQIVGFDVKHSLMFSNANPIFEVYGIRGHGGTTHTGFADAFRSFWFFGAFVFFGFAWLMRLCWERALQGELLFQFLYLILMKDALHAITHSTSWFVAKWPFIAIFAFPVFWFAYRGLSSSITETPQKRHEPQPSARTPLFTPTKSFPVGR